MARFNWKGICCLILLLAGWELIAQAQLINPLVVPPLSKILGILGELIFSGQIPMQIALSMKRAAAGYFLAAAVFIPLGILMGLSQRVFTVLRSDRRDAAASAAAGGHSCGDAVFRSRRPDENLRDFFLLRMADPAQHA